MLFRSAVVGGIFMVFVLFFPRGIWGSILAWLDRAANRAPRRSNTHAATPKDTA